MHPYFSLKNLVNKAYIIHGKIWVCRVRILFKNFVYVKDLFLVSSLVQDELLF